MPPDGLLRVRLRLGLRAGAALLEVVDPLVDVVQPGVQAVELVGRGADAILDLSQPVVQIGDVLGGGELADARLEIVDAVLEILLDLTDLTGGAGALLLLVEAVRHDQGDHGDRRGRNRPHAGHEEPAAQAAEVVDGRNTRGCLDRCFTALAVGRLAVPLALVVGPGIGAVRAGSAFLGCVARTVRVPRRRLLHQAATRYCSQAAGMLGVATWMKIVGFGALGLRTGSMFTCSGRRSPLRRLQGAQQVTMLSHVDSPPLERGITWSTVRLPRSWPQYWQVQRSRANTARRVILRRCASRGMRT